MIGGLILGLLLVVFFSLAIGAMKIPPDKLWELLVAKVTGAAVSEPRYEGVLWQLRAPRVLLGCLVGASLAVAGALLQGLFRNPLADPGLIGISSGAAFGATFVLVVGAVIWPGVQALSDQRFLPLAAFAGALIVTLLVQRLATSGGYTAAATLLLAGIAINALVGSFLGFATYLATDAQLRTLSFWMLGSLGTASWQTVAIAAPFCGVLVLLAPRWAMALNAMALGEAEARHLGFSVQRVKVMLIVLTAVGVGISVAFTGIIGFVGLVVPHIVRLGMGPDHRWVIPGSALLGALLLVASDTVARTIFAPAELPIGVLTSAFGAPFFLYMLFRQRRAAAWM